MKILVRYRNKTCFWVDTVVECDENEWDVITAVLVTPTSLVLTVPVDEIEVVDPNFKIVS